MSDLVVVDRLAHGVQLAAEAAREEALRDALLNGTPGQPKTPIVDVRVESRSRSIPTFRLPTAPVRVMDRMVGGPGLEPGWITPHAPQTCASAKFRQPPKAGWKYYQLDAWCPLRDSNPRHSVPKTDALPLS